MIVNLDMLKYPLEAQMEGCPKETLLKAFFKITEAILELDAKGNIKAWHHVKKRAFPPLRESDQKEIGAIFPSEWEKQIKFFLSKSFTSQKVQRFSLVGPSEDQAFEITLVPGKNSCLLLLRDISEFSSAEKELRASKNFLENIFNALRDGISILDREFNIVKVNYWMRQRYEHVLPLEGKKCYQVYQQRDFVCPWCPSAKTLTTGLPAEEIVPYVTEKGLTGWIELSTFPLRNEKGELIGVIEHCKDVTQRIQVEKERKLLAQAVEHATEAIIITDRRGRIIYLNPAFERITGYQSREVLNQTPNFLRDGDKASYREIWSTLSRGKPWQGKVEVRHQKGHKIHVELSIAPVRNEEGKISNYVAVLHDITERVELETQLRRSQKLEAVGRLAGGIAHDFNNILTAVIGYTELLLKRVKDDPAERYAKNILSSLQRAAALTQKLLTFSKHRPQKQKLFDLQEVLKELYPMMRRLIEERIRLDLLLPEEELPLLADPTDIEQIIINLVLNASEAIAQKGHIVISLSREAPPFASSSPEEYVKIKVVDDGKGIPKEHLELIFGPFFTTKETGSGLGLFVVYNTVKHLKGHIKVSSEPRSGATFEVFLPLSNGVPERESVSQSVKVSESKWEDLVVLVVEDEPLVRNFLREVLCQSGARVLEAQNGEEALSILASYPQKIDLLLTDVMLPALDGPSLGKEARKIRPEIKIIFISGYPKDKELPHLPDISFLAKPFTAHELLKTIERVTGYGSC